MNGRRQLLKDVPTGLLRHLPMRRNATGLWSRQLSRRQFRQIARGSTQILWRPCCFVGVSQRKEAKDLSVSTQQDSTGILTKERGYLHSHEAAKGGWSAAGSQRHEGEVLMVDLQHEGQQHRQRREHCGELQSLRAGELVQLGGGW